MKSSLPAIKHNQQGFESLVSLHKQTKGCYINDVEIDLGRTSWLDADMCAALGALLYRLRHNLNEVNLINIPATVKAILSKNGFLSHYGHEKVTDTYGTTISYKRFDVEDERYFSAYIEEEFIRRSEMPDMSPGLLKKFRESIFEIFSNAVLHSRTELGIFSCGQFFPRRGTLDFTLVDLGVGIQENVRRYEELELEPEEAIDWATRAGNTTKRKKIPGGLGLKLLCEFVDLNGGSIQIVSDAGYWRRQSSNTAKAKLDHPFPGTAVCLEINAADTQSYALESELTEGNIL